MAKDYFQDIVPPGEPSPKSKAARSRIVRPVAKKHVRTVTAKTPEPEPKIVDSYTDADDEDTIGTVSNKSSENDHRQFNVEEPLVQEAPRGIRSINVNPTRPTRSRIDTPEVREYPTFNNSPRPLPPRPNAERSRLWIWIVAAVCIVVLIGIALVAFRSTTVTVTPREQDITFDQSAQFIAYPAASAASGTLAYTVATTNLSASESAAGQGTTHVDSKASGTITVYNNYSASSVKLVASTRFASSGGLIFRTPATVVIPGKSGSTPGQVSITVFADQAGSQYDVAPGKFTVPGLQSTPAMYAGIYAQSTSAMSGGFSGNENGVSDTQRAAAVADLRAQLQEQAAQYAASLQNASTTAFASLAQVAYQDMPDTEVSSSSVGINESATVSIPVFAASDLASTVAFAQNITTSGSSITLVAGHGYGAELTSASSTVLGTDPVDFSLVGSASLVWQIDQSQLASALAGKNQSAFQSIIAGFPGIQSAHARIEPFWSQTFPSNPSSIKITVLAPQSGNSGSPAPNSTSSSGSASGQ